MSHNQVNLARRGISKQNDHHEIIERQVLYCMRRGYAYDHQQVEIPALKTSLLDETMNTSTSCGVRYFSHCVIVVIIPRHVITPHLIMTAYGNDIHHRRGTEVAETTWCESPPSSVSAKRTGFGSRTLSLLPYTVT